VEISALLKIVLISARMGNYEPSKIMYKTMISDNFITSYTGDTHFLPGVYASLSHILGMQDLHSQVVDLSLKGIEYCRTYEVSSALAHLLVFNALGNLDLDNFEVAKESAKKAYMQAYLDNDESKFDSISKIILKKFNITGEQLLCNK
jgi:hypothetical protein